MRRATRLVAVAAALSLMAAACGDDDDDTTAGGGDTGGGTEAAELTVQIDGDADDFNAAMIAYFPDKVTARPGDTIVYESNFSGEPHSITFGTIIDDVVQAESALTPEQQEGDEEPPPEAMAAFERVPAMLPEGPGDANQASVNPCFVTTGELPDDPTQQCEVTEPEPFTGTELFYNSGFLPDGETFELQLSEDIAPGTYVGICTLHFTDMTSEITVVAADQDIPSADEVEAEGDRQRQEIAEALRPAYEQAQEETPEGTVFAGVGPEDEEVTALVAEFVPEAFEVAAGEEVTWEFFGPHTVSFNAPEEARVLLAKGDDGGYHLNAEAMAPAGFEPPEGEGPPGGEGPPEGEGAPEGGEGPPESEGPPEGEEGPPPATDAGEWNGTGFFSSGFSFGFKMSFAEPGTYEYVCLIHPDMEGTVTVT